MANDMTARSERPQYNILPTAAAQCARRPAMLRMRDHRLVPAETDREARSPAVYPFAIMFGAILVLIGGVEVIWLAQALVAAAIPVDPTAGGLTAGVALGLLAAAPAVLAFPAGIWLIRAPASGRVIVTVLLVATLASLVTALNANAHGRLPFAFLDAQQVRMGATLVAAAVFALWLERGILRRAVRH